MTCEEGTELGKGDLFVGFFCFPLVVGCLLFHRIYGNFDISLYSCSSFVLQVSWPSKTLFCPRWKQKYKNMKLMSPFLLGPGLFLKED